MATGMGTTRLRPTRFIGNVSINVSWEMSQLLEVR